jgi:arylformamidase
MKDEWLDISVPIRDGMVTWPDNPPVRVVRTRRLDRGDDANVSSLFLGVHTGTHVDAPVHFIDGALGVDRLSLDSLIGPARVVDMGAAKAIDRLLLEEVAPEAGERLLFRTSNCERCWPSPTFVHDYVHLTPDGARFLVERRVRTVGIDYLSIGSPTEGPTTHQILLAESICIIEGLNLSGVEPGRYDLVCLPLRLEGGDGAPARAVLRPRRQPA